MTFDPLINIRPHIQGMPPYEPILPYEVLSQQLGIPADQIVKLDANENPYGTLGVILEHLGNLTDAHIYPDPESRFLRQALAKAYGVPADNILAGAGADELIDLILRLFIEPGDCILNCPPTFGMYAFGGDLNAARVISIPRLVDFSLDLSAIERAIVEYHPKLLFLANPNNPDGSLTPPSMLERLLELPLVLVLDEAYMEFAPPEASWLVEVTRRANLVVLRTFSKWAGLAGLRVGFGVFPLALMQHLWKIKQPYNVATSASWAARVALQHAAEIQITVQKIIAERANLFAALQSMHWLKPYPSQANFILCRVEGCDAYELKLWLAQRGILVRYFNKPGLQNCIRVSVGKPEHTEALLTALREVKKCV